MRYHRLAKLFLCRSPLLFRAVWAIVKPFIDPVTRTKVVFINEHQAADIFVENFDPKHSIPAFSSPSALEKTANDNQRTSNPSRLPQTSKAAHSTVVELAAEAGSKPYVWARNWWPISPVNYLDPLKPTPRTILGTKLALWHHATQGWCAVADSCPHRLAPLSEGRIVAGGTQLACSYHGWKFDDKGKCTTIPQLPDSKAATTALASPRSCAVSYPTAVVGVFCSYGWM
ncbi:MAG: hypothetical protein WDW38_007509 [Sanguina aurantia]